ncbi:hypothetical protein CVT25_003621 [Psilocybe cyanescens]|uniref:DUF6535 domain-containing protein n=1 Tax=Psilocybe cyanescens TaxID=93625 RepID=A0A409WPA2_PSICY|nr:hypothetical protein CVT25_003621 [Psilocybe cyanescens]
MLPIVNSTRGRSRSSASYLSVDKPSQGRGSPELSLSLELSSTELSPTIAGDHGSFLLPSPLSPNASSSSSLSPSAFLFPSPKSKLHNGDDNDNREFYLHTSPSLSEIDLGRVPDIVIPDSSPLKCGDHFRFPIPEPRCDSWETAYVLAKNHDKAMCDLWKEEIDKLLIFGGLFAATVVAFLVVSYQLLQPSPDEVQKATTNMLVTIIRQYANGTLLESNLHFPPSPNNFQPSPAVLRMNIAWFLSMTMALSAVLIGTVCLQWIREYQRDPRVNAKLAFAIRQMRWDGLQSWKVPAIVSSLPIILQLSLFLFFWGLLEFLWSLNTAVTLINSVVIGAVLFFMVATIFLPALQIIFIGSDTLQRQGQCPYKSPLARVSANVLFWLALQVIDFIRPQRNSGFLERKKKFLEEILHARNWEDWVSFDGQWQSWRTVHPPSDSQAGKESCDIPRGLAWLGSTYVHNQDAIYALYHLLRRIHPSTSVEALKTLIAKPGFTSFSALTLASAATHHDGKLLDDLYSALLLNHVASSSKDPYLQEALWPQRTELFIRIANYGAAASTTRLPGDTTLIEQCIKDKDFGINPFVGNLDYMKLPEGEWELLAPNFNKH